MWNEEHRRVGRRRDSLAPRRGTRGFRGRERNRNPFGSEPGESARDARRINIYSAAGFISHAFLSYYLRLLSSPPTVMENRCCPCEEADLHRRSESAQTFLNIRNMRLLSPSALLKKSAAANEKGWNHPPWPGNNHIVSLESDFHEGAITSSSAATSNVLFLIIGLIKNKEAAATQPVCCCNCGPRVT